MSRMHSYPPVVGYVYKANMHCRDCLIKELKKERKIDRKAKVLDLEATLDVLSDAMDIYRYDEWEFDSDDFPKVIFRHDVVDDIYICTSCDTVFV
jgi:hypothetical protein